MLKYEKHGETISVKLKGQYSVFCMAYWNVDKRFYELTLYLQEDTVGILKMLPDCINVPIHAKKNNLYSSIVEYIESLIEDRYFDKQIKKYDFELQCFDKGIEILLDDEPSSCKGEWY